DKDCEEISKEKIGTASHLRAGSGLRTMYSERDAARPLRDARKKDREPFRSPWRRDYARLIHSPSFRRLQGKTQVFPGHESDFYRNRLTHSLEVAQIAKSIA